MSPLDILNEAIEQYHPSAVFALFSGGHDSLCSTQIASQHPSFTAAVHINTGIGIEETREYVRTTCAEMGWPLIELRTDPAVYRRQVLSHGFPAGGAQHSILYRILKERRVEQLIREHKTHRVDRILLVAGARKQESTRRMGTAQRITQRKSQVWTNPILDWSHADKEDHIERFGLPRNQVVDNLHMSGECLCGCYANMPKSRELEQIAFWYPRAAAEIRALEREVFEAGQWPNWGAFRAGQTDRMDRRQQWLPLCQSCETRWEAGA